VELLEETKCSPRASVRASSRGCRAGHRHLADSARNSRPGVKCHWGRTWPAVAPAGRRLMFQWLPNVKPEVANYLRNCLLRIR